MRLANPFNRAVTALAAALAAILLLAAAPSHATDPAKAEAFVDELGHTAIEELSDPNKPREERIEVFRDLLHDGFAVEAISRFVLGRYWRVASEEEKTEFIDTLEQILVQRFLPLFEGFDPNDFETIGSKPDPNSNELALVGTDIYDPNSGETVRATWRIREIDGEMKIVDVMAEGVSMAITFRSEFNSVIQRGGGDVSVLINDLQENLEQGAFEPDKVDGLVQ